MDAEEGAWLRSPERWHLLGFADAGHAIGIGLIHSNILKVALFAVNEIVGGDIFNSGMLRPERVPHANQFSECGYGSGSAAHLQGR